MLNSSTNTIEKDTAERLLRGIIAFKSFHKPETLTSLSNLSLPLFCEGLASIIEKGPLNAPISLSAAELCQAYFKSHDKKEVLNYFKLRTKHNNPQLDWLSELENDIKLQHFILEQIIKNDNDLESFCAPFSIIIITKICHYLSYAKLAIHQSTAPMPNYWSQNIYSMLHIYENYFSEYVDSFEKASTFSKLNHKTLAYYHTLLTDTYFSFEELFYLDDDYHRTLKYFSQAYFKLLSIKAHISTQKYKEWQGISIAQVLKLVKFNNLACNIDINLLLTDLNSRLSSEMPIDRLPANEEASVADITEGMQKLHLLDRSEPTKSTSSKKASQSNKRREEYQKRQALRIKQQDKEALLRKLSENTQENVDTFQKYQNLILTEIQEINIIQLKAEIEQLENKISIQTQLISTVEELAQQSRRKNYLEAKALEEKHKTMYHIFIPINIAVILLALERRGYFAYLFGGYPVKTTRGIPAKDFDIVTNCPAELLHKIIGVHFQKNDYKSDLYCFENIDIKLTQLPIKAFLANCDIPMTRLLSNKDGWIIDLENVIPSLLSPSYHLVVDPHFAERWEDDPVQILRLLRYHAMQFLSETVINVIKERSELIKRIPLKPYLKNISALFLNAKPIALFYLHFLLENGLLLSIFPGLKPEHLAKYSEFWQIQLTQLNSDQLGVERKTVYDILSVFLLPLAQNAFDDFFNAFQSVSTNDNVEKNNIQRKLASLSSFYAEEYHDYVNPIESLHVKLESVTLPSPYIVNYTKDYIPPSNPDKSQRISCTQYKFK